MPGIWWLASYPKSGNTWMRALLSNYFRAADQPAEIDELGVESVTSSRDLCHEITAIESSDLTDDEIDRYPPAVAQHLADNSVEPLIVKLHDAYRLNSDGAPIFPATATAGVIYLIRDPRDVAVSFAHHENVSLQRMINIMAAEKTTLASSKTSLTEQLPQRLFSWSNHVRSWVDESGLATHVVRYEDLLRQTRATFRGVLRFMNAPVDEQRVDRAIANSRFELFQQQEAQHGFIEKSPGAASFFRAGQTGSWQKALSNKQAQQLARDHFAMMARFCYISLVAAGENDLKEAGLDGD